MPELGWLLMPFILFSVYCIVVYGLSNPESGLGKIVVTLWPFPVPKFIQDRRARLEEAAAARLREATQERDPEQIIRETQVGNFLMVMGRNLQYKAKMILLELQYFGADKADKRHVNPISRETLREFTAIILSGDRMLMEQPVAEGGEMSWYMWDRVGDEVRLGFFEYLKGTESEPGPGALFAKHKQGADITIKELGRTWLARDIVWVDVQVEAGKPFVSNASNGSMARVAMILWRKVNGKTGSRWDFGDDWLLSADLRSGNGSDTVWCGRRFNPDDEVDT